MPESRSFMVKQTRQVKVTAHTAVEAAIIAAEAFNQGQNSDGTVIDGPLGIYGNTTSTIVEVDLSVTDRFA